MTVQSSAIQTAAIQPTAGFSAIRLSLWEAPKQALVAVTGLHEGLNPLVVNRLREMGLEPGQSLLCLGRGPFNGPVIVQIQDCVYTLERQVAQHILVQSQL